MTHKTPVERELERTYRKAWADRDKIDALTAEKDRLRELLTGVVRHVEIHPDGVCPFCKDRAGIHADWCMYPKIVDELIKEHARSC